MSFWADVIIEVRITIDMKATSVFAKAREFTDAYIIRAAEKSLMMSTEECLQLVRVSSGFGRSWHLCLVHQFIIASSYQEPSDITTSILVQYYR